MGYIGLQLARQFGMLHQNYIPTTQTFLGLRHMFLLPCVMSQKNVREGG